MKKNFSFKAFFITAKAFVKKNVLSCLCLLLATLVAITGSISYSKYISTAPAGTHTPGAGSFTASASIDGISALSFTNTAFWGGTVEDDKIAMNALRSINFSVNNFSVVEGVEKVAEVRMKYNLSFSAPVNFVHKLAIQLFNEEDKPMLPQIVLMDFINAATHGHAFQTATSNDYNSTYHHDLTFQTSKINNDCTGVFDGTIHGEAVKVIVKLEEYTKKTHQLLHFRTWDTSAITSTTNPTVKDEGGKLLPPLQVKFTREIPFYKITISMSNMVLPASEKTTVKHTIRLAPTDTIEDDHLAGYFVKQSTINPNYYEPITSIYGPNDGGNSIDYIMQTVKEQSVSEYYTSEDAFNDAISETDLEQYQKKNHFNEHVVVSHNKNVMGNIHVYNKDEVGTFVDNSSSSMLELGSFIHEEREYIDHFSDHDVVGGYIYVKRLGTPGNYTWQLVTESEATSNGDGDQTKYFRIYVKYGELINKTEVKLTAGVLKTEMSSREDYVVKNVITTKVTDEETHDDILLHVTANELIRYTITENASGTLTLTRHLDIEEEGLIWYEKDGGDNWVKTTTQLTEPNLVIKPLVVKTQEYTNVNDEVVYQKSVTDYIIRELIRDTKQTDVEVEEVKTTIINGEGVPEDVYYTQSSPLAFFQTQTDPGGNNVDVQKIFLSQCYSKNYPFYVNVVFEQVLE